MFLLRLLIITFFIMECFSSEINVDSITLAKIKKMVEKEEEIAYAYKKYIIKNGKVPDNLNSLLSSSDYLPTGYSNLNSFGKVITINTTNHQLEDFIPLNTQLKSNLYDYYYSNKNREYTKAPLSFENNNVNIILSDDEKFIVENSSNITKTQTEAINKYYLDDRGVLHWYDNTGSYKFSVTKDLIVDQSVSILNANGTKTDYFNTLMENKNVMYAGQKILQKNNDTGTIDEYLNTNTSLLELNKSRNIGQTILKFTKYGGGMVVNGDIYTWGNDKNNITGIGKSTYTTTNGVSGIGDPVINTFINAKAIMYDDTKTTLQDVNELNTRKFFSSPLRPKFVDFFSDVVHSTCGITTKQELYCGGKDALENNYIPFLGHTKGSLTNLEYLYRSTMFDGINNKSRKIFALGNTYIVLGKSITDTLDGYNVYYWGKDNANGWAGTGNKSEINVFTPTKSNNIRFKDLAYTYQDGYKKIAGLDLQGNIYTWGLGTNISSCIQPVNGENFNFCQPLEVVSDVNFVSIEAGQKDFIATDSAGNFYKISQQVNSKAVIESISSLIASKTGYIAADDARILSVDTTISNGIVWVNGKNQLKGDYYIPSGANAVLFNNTINKIGWKNIRVIEDNMMCGTDVNNQLYCWGNMSISGTKTFMLPIFMSNLHDENKDFLLVENDSSNVLTTMTSGEWLTSSAYVINYPTYISGFNYEFIFK